MRAIILYWSVSGTTRRVAEQIAEGIRAQGAECVLHDLRLGPPHALASYDLIGIGSPVHFYRLPVPVSDAMKSFGGLEGRSGFVFTLNGTYRGKALNQARVLLARTGLTEVGAFGCYGEGRFIGYTRLGYEFSTGHPTSTELESAQRFGAEVIRAHRAASGGGPAPTPHSRDPRTHVVYAVERAVTGPWLARSLYSRLFRADTAQCTRCGRCVKACPTGNITLERGELPKWGGDCVICGTCALVCPESAVRCPYDWPVFTPFMRYNTRRAARDPGLEHSRVVWRRGEIIRED